MSWRLAFDFSALPSLSNPGLTMNSYESALCFRCFIPACILESVYEPEIARVIIIVKLSILLSSL